MNYGMENCGKCGSEFVGSTSNSDLMLSDAMCDDCGQSIQREVPEEGIVDLWNEIQKNYRLQAELDQLKRGYVDPDADEYAALDRAVEWLESYSDNQGSIAETFAQALLARLREMNRMEKVISTLSGGLDQRPGWVSVDEAATKIINEWPDNDVVMLTEGRNPETISAQFLLEVGASHYAVLPPLPDNQEVSS